VINEATDIEVPPLPGVMSTLKAVESRSVTWWEEFVDEVWPIGVFDWDAGTVDDDEVVDGGEETGDAWPFSELDWDFEESEEATGLGDDGTETDQIDSLDSSISEAITKHKEGFDIVKARLETWRTETKDPRFHIAGKCGEGISTHSFLRRLLSNRKYLENANRAVRCRSKRNPRIISNLIRSNPLSNPSCDIFRY